MIKPDLDRDNMGLDLRNPDFSTRERREAFAQSFANEFLKGNIIDGLRKEDRNCGYLSNIVNVPIEEKADCLNTIKQELKNVLNNYPYPEDVNSKIEELTIYKYEEAFRKIQEDKDKSSELIVSIKKDYNFDSELSRNSFTQKFIDNLYISFKELELPLPDQQLTKAQLPTFLKDILPSDLVSHISSILRGKDSITLVSVPGYSQTPIFSSDALVQTLQKIA